MAVHTPAHGETVVLFNDIHLLDWAMTSFTGGVAIIGFTEAMNVALVIEFYMVRKHVHFDPVDGFAIVILFL